MKSRVLGFVIIAAAVAAIGVQQAQVASLREDVARLRASIQQNQRARLAQPIIVPIQGQLPPAKPRSPFRLIDGDVNDSIERGMKADEFEMQRRQQQWYKRQQNPYAPDPQPRLAPPWAENAVPKRD
jgi:hypothetical protein